MTADSNILDFGCGWGRILRIFLRDAKWENIWGFDPWHVAIDVCKKTGIYSQLVKTNLLPPVPVRSDYFDVAYAYSVFSHLSEAASNLWVAELARILKPGGMLFITTQGKAFMERREAMVEAEVVSHREQTIVDCLPDIKKMRDAYSAGEFIFAATGGGKDLPSNLYGQSIIPSGYVADNWLDMYELVDYVDDPKVLSQALIVLKKYV